ncbi:hypothetical protein PPL_09057 [Heterostelium album PN500]|uniref:Uncharacterized protein n=1 Tax=Heterostelium pallidum (strain ATCC 26659 / Pp 5 / PN500) TaxID=670386 RepID=D3BKH6_HETP5|nr:hypothetical protein PPL_09057 [Heterostelium album PN500]EFA78406.1 hypothetical protein PPL_09057 [Heterostelium album PN500]|eukprot:XP_020430531.1 hypothetical protein PPL_09057 [Heterostelium album PN500]
MKEAKETKEELEITRVNYDQQMKMLTEQYISLNESLSQLDTELIKIKQHKILCAKCRAWNPLENVFAPDNHQLLFNSFFYFYYSTSAIEQGVNDYSCNLFILHSTYKLIVDELKLDTSILLSNLALLSE